MLLAPSTVWERAVSHKPVLTIVEKQRAALNLACKKAEGRTEPGWFNMRERTAVRWGEEQGHLCWALQVDIFSCAGGYRSEGR